MTDSAHQQLYALLADMRRDAAGQAPPGWSTVLGYASRLAIAAKTLGDEMADAYNVAHVVREPRPEPEVESMPRLVTIGCASNAPEQRPFPCPVCTWLGRISRGLSVNPFGEKPCGACGGGGVVWGPPGPA